jgi:hypothetical protein
MFLKTNILLVICFVAMPTTAYAYLDPGTGSMIIQMVIGAIAAGLLTLKFYWHKITTFFRDKKKAPRGK